MNQQHSNTVMSPREIAADIARELREHPERWMQGSGWTDAEGNVVSSTDAVRACLVGHIIKREGFSQDQNTCCEMVAAIGCDPARLSLAEWNDQHGRSVDEVIALCERVAAS